MPAQAGIALAAEEPDGRGVPLVQRRVGRFVEIRLAGDFRGIGIARGIVCPEAVDDGILRRKNSEARAAVRDRAAEEPVEAGR